MPFPDPISLTAFGSSRRWGPFSIGGVLYAATDDSLGTSKILIKKSIDNGATWTDEDDLAAPVRSLANPEYVACLGGTSLFITYCGLDGVDWYTYVAVFDTVTDTWQSNTRCNLANAGLGTAWGGGYPRNYFRALDSVVIVLATTVGFDTPFVVRNGYFLFDSIALTFGPWIPCGEIAATNFNWYSLEIVEGIGEVHFFFSNDDFTGALPLREVYRQPLSDADVLGALVLVTSINDVGGTTNSNLFRAASDGITIAIAWQPSLLTPNAIEVLIAPAATMLFVAQALVSTMANIDAVGLMVDAITGVVLCIDSDDGVNWPFDYAIDAGAGFGAFVNVADIYVDNLFVGLVAVGTPGVVCNALMGVGYGSAFGVWGVPPPPPPGTPPWTLIGAPFAVSLPNPQTQCISQRPRRCATQLARQYQDKVTAYAAFGPKQN